MKFFGKKVEKVNEEVIVIPRGDGEDLVFKARAVIDFEPFEQICPSPKPPTVIRPGEKTFSPDFSDPAYIAAVTQNQGRRMAWLVIESLKATEGLEWETVDYAKPETWEGYSKELKESNITDIEINKILSGVMSANCLNEDRVQEARMRFLASQKAPSSS